MTAFKLPGINTVRAKGKVYYYHRASGTRIKADPNDLLAFASEVAALDAAKPKIEAPTPGSLGGLITAYKRSPEWAGLAPDTQKSYQRAFNALQPIDALSLEDLDSAAVLTIRDKVYAKNGRWLANMVVAVLSVVLAWGTPRKYVQMNAAAGVPKIRRSRQLGVANKAWLPAEVDAILRAAPTPGVRKAVALAYYTGLRKKDIVELPASARAAGEIAIERSSKPGVPLSVFEAKRLTAILDEPDLADGPTLVRTEAGTPYTRDGLDSIFHRLKTRLAAEGQIRTGLTFHGLRKSLGKDAADLGIFGENAIAGALGQTSPASARPYTVEAQQRDAARKVIRALERRGKR